MPKELFISSSSHETKVAVLEDDQLVEVYYERDRDIGLAGGIYKGRVSRVLPGMQSAFVDIGLERDAFLYVSDFFEDSEEYEKIFAEAEVRVARYIEGSGSVAATYGTPLHHPGQVTQGEIPASETEAEKAPAAVVSPSSPETIKTPPTQPSSVAVSPPPAEAAATPPPTASVPPSPARPMGEALGHRRLEHRGRRRRRRGRSFGEHKFAPKPDPRSFPPEQHDYGALHSFEILPGESLARYSHVTPEAGSQTTASAISETASGEGALTGPALGEVRAQGLAPVQAGIPVETIFEQALLGPSISATEPSTIREPSMSDASAMEAGRHGDQREPEPQTQTVSNQPVTASCVEAPPSSDQAARTLVEPTQGTELAPPPAISPAQAEPADHASPLASHSLGAAPPPPPVQSEATPVEHTTVQPPPPETPPETAERTYTLREPHQRPRFAPRRGRRGRQGMSQSYSRPEGSQSYRHEPSRPENNQRPQISELLKEGQEILVQIAKEPLGTKGARITSHIALPGRYLVYMPTIDHIGVSRKIESEQERLRLRNILLENRGSLTGGLIVRTAGESRSEEEFKADLKFLSALWNEIRAKAERSKAPALLHRDLDLVQRILRDILSRDFKAVRVDNEIEYERVLEFVNRCQPSLVGHVKLYSRDTPLFEEFGIQAEIDKALKPKVWLKSGGYIVVNQTEALVAIDVNTGKYVGKTNRLEDTIVKTNIDAVNEIVRQIRLRDLGGIIVVDFIDMDERRNRHKVVQALEEALRHDRAPTKILSFNEFGLVALTRKRVKQSLERTLCEPCQYCTGSGWIKSVTTVCYEILAEVRKMASHFEGSVLTLRVNPEVAAALKSREGMLISELESITHKDVVIRSDPAVHQERFEIF